MRDCIFYEGCPDETRPQQYNGAIILAPSAFPADAAMCGEPELVARYRVQAQFFLPDGTPAANIDIVPQIASAYPAVSHCHPPSVGPPMYQSINGLLVPGLTDYPTSTDADGYLVFEMVTCQQSQATTYRYVSNDHRYVAGSSCGITFLTGVASLIKVPQPGDEGLIPVETWDLRHLDDYWVDSRVYPALRSLAYGMWTTVVDGVLGDGGKVKRFATAAEAIAIAGCKFLEGSVRQGGVIDGSDWFPEVCRHRHGLSVDLKPGVDKGWLLYYWLRANKRLFATAPPPLHAQPIESKHSVPWDTVPVIHLEWENP